MLNTDQIPDETTVSMIMLAAEAVHEPATEVPLDDRPKQMARAAQATLYIPLK